MEVPRHHQLEETDLVQVPLGQLSGNLVVLDLQTSQSEDALQLKI